MRVAKVQNHRVQGPWDDQNIEAFHRLYALRSELAGFAAREAARRVRGGKSAVTLEERLKAMHAQAGRKDFEAFFEADMMFHRAIAQLADSPPLAEMWALLESQFRDFAAWSHRSIFGDLQIIADAHTPQYQTIAAGNAAAAEHAAQVDLDALWQMLTEQPAEPSEEADPVERVCGYVLLNLHRKLSVEGVAKDVAHLSSSQLARLFRERRQETFTEYVQRLRLRRAATLLKETDLAVGDIAYRVGYTDSSRFTAHYRRYFGRTPSDERKTNE